MCAQHRIWNPRRMFGGIVAGLLLLSMLTACGSEMSEAVTQKDEAAHLLEQSYLLKEEEALLLSEAAKLQKQVGKVFHAAEKLERKATNPAQFARVEPTINRLLEIADDLENESENLVAESAGVREEAAELLLRASRYQAAEILLPARGGEETLEGGEGGESSEGAEVSSRIEAETPAVERETPEREVSERQATTPTAGRVVPAVERTSPTTEREVVMVEPTPVAQPATPTTGLPVEVEPAPAAAGVALGLDEIASDLTAYVGDKVTVTGEVDSILTPEAFRLQEDSPLSFLGVGEEILVVYPDGVPAAGFSTGDQVQVTGIVSPFVRAEFERQLGITLDETALSAYERRPSLAASEVMVLSE